MWNFFEVQDVKCKQKVKIFALEGGFFHKKGNRLR